MSATAVAATAATTAGILVVHAATPATHTASSPARVEVASNRAAMDAAVTATVVAAARLDAFSHAAHDRQSVVLDRAQADLAAATSALSRIQVTAIPASATTQVHTAQAALAHLAPVVTGLLECAAHTTSTPTPPPSISSLPHGKNTAHRTSSTTPSPRPRTQVARSSVRSVSAAACSVNSDEVDAARATGAAMAALVRYGSLSAAEVGSLSVSAKTQAEAEAAPGSTTTVHIAVPSTTQP